MGGRKAQWLGMLRGHGAGEAGRLVEQAGAADPTPGKGYTAWILKQVKAGEVRLPEDADAVRRLLAAWEEVKARCTGPGGRDIHRHGYRELASLVRRAEGTASRRQRELTAKREGARVVGRDGEFRVVEVTAAEAAAIYSRGTRWCTADPEAAAGYLGTGRLYVLFDGGRRLALAHWATGQLRDVRDRPAVLPAGLKRLLRRATGRRVGPGREGRMQRLAGLLGAPAGRAAEAWRELVRDCYAAHDFVVLGCVLRFFPEAGLTEVCLDYLNTGLVRLLWYVFWMPPADRIEMGSRPPLGDSRLGRRRQREFLAFFEELRQVKAGRPGPR